MLRMVMLGLALATVTVSAAAALTDAPADEYFGPFKYSAISVRTKIDMLARSYRERWTDDASIVHDAGLVESSLMAWAQKYPKDKWLAPTAFHLAQLYQNVQTPEARAKARAMYAYVAKTYPTSKEAHSSRLRLAQGFPALQPETAVAPTPNPYGSAAPAAAVGDAAPAGPASGAPAAASSPGASAAPQASGASAAPAARTAAPATAPATAAPTAAPKASAKP